MHGDLLGFACARAIVAASDTIVLVREGRMVMLRLRSRVGEIGAFVLSRRD